MQLGIIFPGRPLDLPHRTSMNPYNVRRHAVDKIPIVAYHDQFTFPRPQKLFKPSYRDYIEKVRRLVQKKHVWFGDQGFGESDTHLEPPGKFRWVAFKILFAKTKPKKNLFPLPFAGNLFRP